MTQRTTRMPIRTLQQFVTTEKKRDPVFASEFDRLRVARRVRELRELRNLSQTELAARVGTRQPNIARLESGRSLPTLDVLQRVAHALGVQLEVKLVDRKSA